MSEKLTPADYEEVLADHRALVRRLDVALNGGAGAAKQASLCDIVGQVEDLKARLAIMGGIPDRAVVWNFDGFKRELMKQHPYVKVDLAAEMASAFMGFPIVVDEKMPPGTVELRNGSEVIRIINLNI